MVWRTCLGTPAFGFIVNRVCYENVEIEILGFTGGGFYGQIEKGISFIGVFGDGLVCCAGFVE